MKNSTLWLLLFFGYFSWQTLAQTPDSVTLHLEKGELIFPGNSLQLGLFFWQNGTATHTRGLLNGKLPWRKWSIESSINGKVSNGHLRIPHELALVQQKTFTIRVYDRKKKVLLTEKNIAYDYPVRVQPQLPDAFTKAPGFETPFWLTVDWSNGTTMELRHRKSGLIALDDFTYFVEGGAVHRNKLCISPNPHAFKNHTVSLYATARDFVIPDAGAASFLLDYKASYAFSRSGWDGSSGSSGFSGHSGSTGGHGGSGQWGGAGQHGENGPDMKVVADAYYDELLETDLVDIEVTNLNTGSRADYRINPRGGKIVIRSLGGDGGSGGTGGSGGRGGDGAAGDERKIKKKVNDSTYVEETVKGPGHAGGDGGDGGGGGPGGYGGDGGSVHVYYTPAAQPYLSMIQAESFGGSGGWGGAGGSGGSGGSGGAGEPRGRSGSGGRSGPGGPRGGDGRRGEVRFYLVRE